MRGAVSPFFATVVLVLIALVLSFTIYSSLGRVPAGPKAVFSSSYLLLGGSPPIAVVQVNSSSIVNIQSVEVENSVSTDGVMYLANGDYRESSSLCVSSGTAFFSVFSNSPGLVTVASNGATWVDGTWTPSKDVSRGWHAIMISHASRCSVSLPGNSNATFGFSEVSAIPLSGNVTSQSFEFFIPCGPTFPGMTVIFDSGVARIA
jgi:hypothetical protein